MLSILTATLELCHVVWWGEVFLLTNQEISVSEEQLRTVSTRYGVLSSTLLTFGRQCGDSAMTEELRNFWIKQSRPWMAASGQTLGLPVHSTLYLLA